MAHLRYSPSVEQPADDEHETFEALVKNFRGEAETVEKQHGHAMRSSHAKATGYLVGELEISEGLPPELAQGLFARPGRYPVLARLAQGPGEPLPDRVSTHRGIGLKLLGVEGQKIAQSNEAQTQDFVFEAGTVFPQANAKSFLREGRGILKAPALPTGIKQAASKSARGLNRALQAIGLGESHRLDFFGHPKHHPLAEAYFSQTPMRFGDYVAKLGLFPSTEEQYALADEDIDTSGRDEAFREAVIAFSAGRAVSFDLCAQLALDDDTTPIEDASVEWPEGETPYRVIARLTFPPQNAYSEERRAFFDERLSFSPTHSLEAHRPLGSIMRARLAVYPVMSRLRRERTGAGPVEPADGSSVPA